MAKTTSDRRRIDPERVRELAAKGMTDPEIAKEVGCTRSNVNYTRRRHGITSQSWKSLARGRANPDAIRGLVRQGMIYSQIAAELGVHWGTVARACAKHGIAPFLTSHSASGPQAQAYAEYFLRAVRRDNAAFGLPDTLSRTEMRIVLALCDGPATADVIRVLVGRKKRAGRKSSPFTLNKANGKSPLVNLEKAGLIVSLRSSGRDAEGRTRRGRRPNLYMLTTKAMDMLINAPKESPDA